MSAAPGLLAVLAWRNLWRRRGRTAAILFALALGVWSMISLAGLTRGMLEQQLERAIANLTGHVQIHAPGYRDDPVVEHSMPAPALRLRTVLAGPGVAAWGARVRVPAVVASERESAGVTLVGIDPAAEQGLSFIADAVRAGRYLESPADAGLLVGRELAERLETRLGWRVVLMSEGADNELAERGFPIVGVFEAEPEAMETGYVFTGRAVVQAMLGMGDAVSEIALVAPEREQVDAILPRLRAAAPGLEVQPWTEVEPLLVLTEEVSGVILVIWYVVVFTAMSFGLINTLLMAVFERTREFGLFQALGMRPRQIVGQVLAESLILIAIGLVLGNVAAALTLEWLEAGLDLSAFAEGFELAGYSPVLYPAVDAGDVLAANVLVFVLGLAASLYPAWRAARHVPVRALART